MLKGRQAMYERLNRLREDLVKAKARREEADKRVKTLEGKLKEAENNQILSDIGELKLTPEEVAAILAQARKGTLPGTADSSPAADAAQTETEEEESLYDSEDKDFYDKEDDE